MLKADCQKLMAECVRGVWRGGIMNIGRKSELIQQIGDAGDPGSVITALEECRANGWLEDGSLHGVNMENSDLRRAKLSKADLQGAHLAGANLRAADLHGAVLQEADLSGADLGQANLRDADLTAAALEGVRLDGATVTEMQLARAESLADAILPDGNRYDGRYKLPICSSPVRRASIPIRSSVWPIGMGLPSNSTSVARNGPKHNSTIYWKRLR
jgi:hypothetical protein